MNRSDQSSTRTLLPSIVCLALAVLVFAVFFTYQSIREGNALLTTISSQEQPLQQANQIKAQVAALASETAKLAEQGNVGAKQIVEALKSQGIAVQP